jgi:osmoprotectant transport system substrate-binding protein
MMNKTMLRIGSTIGLALFGAGALVACSSADPLENSNGSDGGSENGSGSGDALVIGSQAYYSNEIIAEIYAQALEAGGYEVDRQMRIGQREVYMPEIEGGKIDVFPEYTGNLLQYLDADATATESQDVYDALTEAMPDGVRVLDQSAASDQDSYVVTKAFADEHGLSTIADLAGVSDLTLGGNSELEVRPYGPEGLKSVYGVDVAFTPIEDSGGPLTVKALMDDQVQLVDLYSADPALASGDLVMLEDPEGLFLASHVVPVVSDAVDDDAAAIIDEVSAALTAEDLVALNAQSVDDESPAATIAGDWLAENSLD